MFKSESPITHPQTMPSDSQLLASIAKHFKSAEAKFENGVLFLRSSYCPNMDNFVAGWRKTMYTEKTTRYLWDGIYLGGAS